MTQQERPQGFELNQGELEAIHAGGRRDDPRILSALRERWLAVQDGRSSGGGA